MATNKLIMDDMKRQLLIVDKLRARVRQVLQCVINLHIEILVLESNVTQLLDEVKELNGDLVEVRHLDELISTLRDYSGPTICHEWPYPLIYKGSVDTADVAQILNVTHTTPKMICTKVSSSTTSNT